MKITRREFFNKACRGAALIAVPALITSVLESCSTNSSNPVSPNSSGLPTLQASLKNNVISLKIDSSSPLGTAGSAVLLEFSNGNILVDRPDQNSFNALSAICTHQGCLITGYDQGNKQFVCPCHGSTFNLKGGVVRGPATRALATFQTQFSNDQLDINV